METDEVMRRALELAKSQLSNYKTIRSNKMPFNREERYQVTKLKTGKQVKCVVVEEDWPEYEVVWKMIQDRVEGRLNELESARRNKVFAAIDSERIYQELRWGTLAEHPQSVGAYLTLMRVHLADAEAAWARSNGDEAALDRLRRVLAIGVACGEQHGMPKRNCPAETLDTSSGVYQDERERLIMDPDLAKTKSAWWARTRILNLEEQLSLLRRKLKEMTDKRDVAVATIERLKDSGGKQAS